MLELKLTFEWKVMYFFEFMIWSFLLSVSSPSLFYIDYFNIDSIKIFISWEF